MKSKFRRKSFLRAMIVGTLLFMIPAIVLPTFITARVFNNDMRIQNEAQTIKSFEVAEDRIEELLNDAHIMSHAVQQRADIENYLVSRSDNGEPNLKINDEIISILGETLQSYDYLNSIIFMKDDGSILGTSNQWRFTKAEDYEMLRNVCDSGDREFTNVVTWMGAVFANEVNSLAAKEQPMPKDIMIYGVRRTNYNLAFSEQNSVVDVFISLTQESLNECFDFLGDGVTKVVLLDRNGHRIAGCDFDEFKTIPEYFDEIDKTAENGSFIFNGEEERQQIIYYNLSRTDWTLVSSTPMSAYTSNTRMMIKNASIVGIVVILIMCVLYSIWAIKFCKPIKDMTETLKRVEDGDLDVRLSESAKEIELHTMQIQFNQMLDSINTLIKQKEETERDKMRLEMRSLQAQITPHFIYNTITSIRWMATMCGAHKVADMLISLISLLRPVFSEWTPDWTLNEEIQYVSKYIDLMRFRFGNMISIEIEKDENTSSLMMPRFVLQPILENCCEHTSVFEKQLDIKLKIELCDKMLVVNVEDNGDGMPQEKLEEIRAKLENVDITRENKRSSGGGIGLVNVNRRIKLYYGEKYGISITSEENKGTNVKVLMGIKRH